MTAVIDGLPFGKLHLLIVEADEFEGSKRKNSQQPPNYGCQVSYNGNDLSTEVYPLSKHPKWYEEFIVIVNDLTKHITITVQERTSLSSSGSSSKKGGKSASTVLDVLKMEPKKRVEEWRPLQGEIGGRIKLVYSLHPISNLQGKTTKKLPSFRLDISQTKVDTGGYVEGMVSFLTPRPIPLKRLYLRLYGKESVNWVEDDLSVETTYGGETSLVNKWYHGWENDKDTIDSGCYYWKFRVKVPENLPPSVDFSMGKILYQVFAYLDHDRHTEGHTIHVHQPSSKSLKGEQISKTHNMEFHACVDKPFYCIEDAPMKIVTDVSLRNFSDYPIKKFKVKLLEKSVFAATNNVLTNTIILFKQDYRERVYGHQQWDGKLIADFPPDYHKVSLSKENHATRISFTHILQIAAVKDSPIPTRSYVEIPIIVTSRAITDLEPKKQLISLQKDMLVTTPPTPAHPRKSSKRKSSRRGDGEKKAEKKAENESDSEESQEEGFVQEENTTSPHPKIKRTPKRTKNPDAPSTTAAIDKPYTFVPSLIPPVAISSSGFPSSAPPPSLFLPVPNQLIDFNVSNSPRVSIEAENTIVGFSNVYNPFAQPENPFSRSRSNSAAAPTNPFDHPTPAIFQQPAATPSPFAPAGPNPFAVTPSTVVTPPSNSYLEKNPFL